MDEDEGILEIEWDERNEGHAAAHGLTPLLVATVAAGAPKLFANKEGRAGTHMMIGLDEGGRFWTVIMLRLGGGRWRPITGWPSTNPEERLYRQEVD